LTRPGIQAVGLLILCLHTGLAQVPTDSGILAITIVDEFGKPIERDSQIEITGHDFAFKTLVRTHVLVPAPFGIYDVSGWSGNRGAPHRLISLAAPRTEVILALSPGELGDRSTLTPWEVRGKLIPPPGKGKTVIARLIGLYSPATEEVLVDPDGSFNL